MLHTLVAQTVRRMEAVVDTWAEVCMQPMESVGTMPVEGEEQVLVIAQRQWLQPASGSLQRNEGQRMAHKRACTTRPHTAPTQRAHCAYTTHLHNAPTPRLHNAPTHCTYTNPHNTPTCCTSQCTHMLQLHNKLTHCAYTIPHNALHNTPTASQVSVPVGVRRVAAAGTRIVLRDEGEAPRGDSAGQSASLVGCSVVSE